MLQLAGNIVVVRQLSCLQRSVVVLRSDCASALGAFCVLSDWCVLCSAAVPVVRDVNAMPS